MKVEVRKPNLSYYIQMTPESPEEEILLQEFMAGTSGICIEQEAVQSTPLQITIRPFEEVVKSYPNLTYEEWVTAKEHSERNQAKIKEWHETVKEYGQATEEEWEKARAEEPITEEWLLSVGFTKQEAFWKDEYFVKKLQHEVHISNALEVRIRGHIVFVSFCSFSTPESCLLTNQYKYVHQLKALWLALTGEELVKRAEEPAGDLTKKAEYPLLEIKNKDNKNENY